MQRQLPLRLLGAVGPGHLASAGLSFCGLLSPAYLLFASGRLAAAGRAKLPGENPRNCFGRSFLSSRPTLGSLGWLRRGTLGSGGKGKPPGDPGIQTTAGPSELFKPQGFVFRLSLRCWNMGFSFVASRSFPHMLVLGITSSLPALLWS